VNGFVVDFHTKRNTISFRASIGVNLSLIYIYIF
jgi:hypothetical protein